jgi:hypothetical protein
MSPHARALPISTMLQSNKGLKMRFNKENTLNHLWQHIERLEKQWGFNPDTGWNQIVGADLQKVIAYGEYDGYKKVIDSINYGTL